MKRQGRKLAILGTLWLCLQGVHAEDGYRLWLRYEPVIDQNSLELVSGILGTISVPGNSPKWEAIRQELVLAAEGMLGNDPVFVEEFTDGVQLVIGTPATSPLISEARFAVKLGSLGPEGYLIEMVGHQGRSIVVVAANEPVGALYGIFHLLRILQSGADLSVLPVRSAPRISRRILNHWDNLDRTVERGYAGFSIWNWHKLPDYIDPR